MSTAAAAAVAQPKAGCRQNACDDFGIALAGDALDASRLSPANALITRSLSSAGARSFPHALRMAALSSGSSNDVAFGRSNLMDLAGLPAVSFGQFGCELLTVQTKK